MKQFEVNFDGLVGPTHNYAGLSFGNVASLNNANAVSSPKQAAKQGLAKAKALADMGMMQGVLAPQERPDIAALRRLGFTGNDARVLESAAKQSRGFFLLVALPVACGPQMLPLCLLAPILPMDVFTLPLQT